MVGLMDTNRKSDNLVDIFEIYEIRCITNTNSSSYTGLNYSIGLYFIG